MAASKTLKDHQIAIVGAGNIGRALIGGLLKGHDIDPGRIRASRRSESALADLGEQFPGIKTTTDNQEAVRGATIIVLAVKPQVVLDIISEIKRVVTEDTLVISVLAGITTDTLHNKFELNLPVVRTMPNTPALVDEGATAMCKGTHANDSNLGSRPSSI